MSSKINKLYVIGGYDLKYLRQIDTASRIVFLDKEQEEFKNQFSLIKSFKEKQDILREKWLLLQEQTFKKIKPYIDRDKDYSYILSNLFFEASPNKIKSIYQFFKLYLLIDYINKKNIKEVFLINISDEIKNFFESNINNFSFSFKILSINKKKKNFKDKLKNLAKKKVLSSILNNFKKEYIKMGYKIPFKKKESKKVVLSYYYPGSLNSNESFSSKYFEEVSNLLNQNYSWLFMYVGNTSNLSNEYKKLKDNKKTFGFLDFYFSYKDFLKVTFNFYKVQKKLNLINIKNLFFLENIDYISLIKNDWKISLSILLLELMILEKKIYNFLKSNPQINEIIYLMEFQPWELMLNKIAKRRGIITKGIIHSVARPNIMNYYHNRSIHSYLNLPSFVGANSDFSKSLLIKNGFDLSQIYKIEAQRFNYLIKNKKKIYIKNRGIRNSILIITSIVPEETKELLMLFASSNIRFEKIYIKEHPLLKVGPIIQSSIKNFPRFEIFNGTVLDAFELSDIVYTANGSSVLLESVIRKKQTISPISLSTLPIPAIDKAPNLYFVYDIASLTKILKSLIESPLPQPFFDEENNHLYLNQNLSLWREFINK